MSAWNARPSCTSLSSSAHLRRVCSSSTCPSSHAGTHPHPLTWCLPIYCAHQNYCRIHCLAVQICICSPYEVPGQLFCYSDGLLLPLISPKSVSAIFISTLGVQICICYFRSFSKNKKDSVCKNFGGDGTFTSRTWLVTFEDIKISWSSTNHCHEEGISLLGIRAVPFWLVWTRSRQGQQHQGAVGFCGFFVAHNTINTHNPDAFAPAESKFDNATPRAKILRKLFAQK